MNKMQKLIDRVKEYEDKMLESKGTSSENMYGILLENAIARLNRYKFLPAAGEATGQQ